MDLLAERNELMQSLNQVQKSMTEMEQKFSELQIQKERIIGAILLIDKLLNSENSEQQKSPDPL